LSGKILKEIPPRWIEALDQLQLPGAAPCLHPVLAGPGALARLVRFVPDKVIDIVLRREPSKAVGLVLGDPPKNVVGVAKIERAVSLTGQVKSRRRSDLLGPSVAVTALVTLLFSPCL
jgi:hypothetical protein